MEPLAADPHRIDLVEVRCIQTLAAVVVVVDLVLNQRVASVDSTHVQSVTIVAMGPSSVEVAHGTRKCSTVVAADVGRAALLTGSLRE